MSAEKLTSAESQSPGRVLEPNTCQKSVSSTTQKSPNPLPCCLSPHLGAVFPAPLVHTPEGAFADHFQDMVLLHRGDGAAELPRQSGR